MNANEKIYIKKYFATTTEDVFERGEVGASAIAWTSKDLPIEGRFDSVSDALKAVCAANYFNDNPDAWMNWAKDMPEESGRFSFSVLVDDENSEASKGDIELWRQGKKRLWSCVLDVYLGVVAERDLTETEAAA